MWGGRSEGGIKGQIGDPVALGKARLNVTTALTIGLSARPATGRTPGQAIELSIKPTGCEFLTGAGVLAAFPPVAILSRLWNRLWTSFGLGDIGSLGRLFAI